METDEQKSSVCSPLQRGERKVQCKNAEKRKPFQLIRALALTIFLSFYILSGIIKCFLMQPFQKF